MAGAAPSADPRLCDATASHGSTRSEPRAAADGLLTKLPCDATASYGSTRSQPGAAADGLPTKPPQQPQGWAAAPYLSEFAGVFLWTAVATSCARLEAGAALSAAVGGCSLAALTWCLASTSGGHLNPAVSCSLCLAGALRWPVACGYAAAQAAGGLAAGLLSGLLLPTRSLVRPLDPSHGASAQCVELLGSALLCLAFCGRAPPPPGREGGPAAGPAAAPAWHRALAVGLVATAGGCVSGSRLNPAAALGLDAADAQGLCAWGLAWAWADLAGAALAAGLLRWAAPGLERLREAHWRRLAARGGPGGAEEAEPGAEPGLDGPAPGHGELEPELPDPTAAEGEALPLAALLAAEFLGTLALALVAGLAAAVGAAACALGAAAALAALADALAAWTPWPQLSPVASLALALAGRCRPTTALASVAAQLAAGCAAGRLCRWLLPVHLQLVVAQEGAEQPPPGAAQGALAAALAALPALALLALAPPRAAGAAGAGGRARLALALGAAAAAGGWALGPRCGPPNPALALALGAAGTGPPLAGLRRLQLALWQLGGGALAAAGLGLARRGPRGRAGPPGRELRAGECLGAGLAAAGAAGCALLPLGAAGRGLAAGAATMAALCAVAPASGGCLNPAVSLTLGLTGGLAWPPALGCVAAQLGACVLTGFAVSLAIFARPVAFEPQAPFSWGSAALAELVFTLLLCLVAGSSPTGDGGRVRALALGLAAVAGGGAAGGFSGGCLNPAMAFGLDLAGTTEATGWGTAWALVELAGAAVAAGALMGRAKLGDAVPGTAWIGLLESVGSFFLTALVGAVSITAPPDGATARCVMGAAVACLLLAFGDGPPVHVSPAVTLAALARPGAERVSPREAFSRWAGQLAGSAGAAALVAFWALDAELRRSAASERGALPGAPLGSLALEILCAAGLALAALCARGPGRGPGGGPALCGCAAAFAAAGAGAGAALSPACALGLAAARAPGGPRAALALAQLGGGLLAAALLHCRAPAAAAADDLRAALAPRAGAREAPAPGAP